MTTLTSINQSAHENSSPLEIIQQLLEQCTLTERLQASAIASLSVGEAAIALHLELAKPKKINAALSSVGLVRSDINKYAKLYEKFGGAKHLFASLGASVLFTLSAPRMEAVRSHILELDEPVDQEMVNALKKELVPAPQKKAKLNGVEWAASPGGGNRSLRIAGEIPDSENARWLNEKFEANNGLMYAVVSEFKQTEHELLSLKSSVAAIGASPYGEASLREASPTPTPPRFRRADAYANAIAIEEKVESALSDDALSTASLSEVAIPKPNSQYPIQSAIADCDVVVTESDKGYFMHQGVVAYKESTPEIDGWQVGLDNCDDTLLITSNQLAPITLTDVESETALPNAYEPMSLFQIEAAGGDINEFVGMEVEVRTMSGKRKFSGILAKFDEKNYFVKVATEEGEQITDLRETWVF
jgi:hypothetical protein